MNLLQRLWKDQGAEGLVEYGLILALFAIAIVVVLTIMGDKIKALFNKTSTPTDTITGN